MDITKKLFFAQRALVTLFSATNKIQIQGDRHLGDLTLRQMLTVPAIIHAPEGKPTINYIARQLGTTKQSARQVVDAMEKKKYIATAPSEKDKRAVNITVTSEGEQAFRTCSQRTDEYLADIFHEFTAEELETLCSLLAKLYRFDGTAQEGFGGHLEYDPNNAEEMLRHHPGFSQQGNINGHVK